jgi:Protein of unknown function (DUF1552)
MSRSMSRRIFLRGLGGACVAAPFLSSLSGRGAKAQAVAPAKQLIVMFTHYGCITTQWFPSKSHGPLSAADLTPTSLAPLAPYVDKLLIPRGIRAMNEWTTTMVRGQGNGQDVQVAGSYFTCQPVTPNSNDPFSFNNEAMFNAMPVGPSLDHVIAQQLSPAGTPLLMRVGNLNDSPSSTISYSAAVTPFPGLGLPSQVFSSLTGLFQGGSVSADSYQAVRGQSILDLVKDDLETLERFDMSQSDKMKLEAWKQLLGETTTMMASAQCNPDVANLLGATQSNVDAAGMTGLGSDMLTTAITDTLDGADIYSAVAVLAAACNANPVIVLKYPGNYVFKGLGIMQESESLNGRLDNASLEGPCEPNAVDMLLTIDRYYARKFATLVGMLDGLPEPDGTTMLDNTAAVWFQERSDGAAMNLNNIPILQAGSAGGYFKTGWAVNVEDGSPTLSNGNSEAACTPGTPDTIDGTTQATGTDPKLANAPINKYYYALMNALGVTAGDDGFPLKGGSAEVSKFGMYDKTEDFIGGGTNPPTIHDPGEFTALRGNS